MTDEKNKSSSDQRGVDGLTEVLRLQAEALSRISERMAANQGGVDALHPGVGMPPPVEPPRESRHLPVMASDPGLHEDSLPVLNSFKKFLDEERHRARKRMIWVLAGFTVVLATVLTVLVWMSGERSKGLEADISKAQSLAERSRQEADAGLRKLGEANAQMATQSAAQIHKDITRNILWAHSVITSNLSSELAGRDSEVDRLREKLAALEIENALLSQQVTEINQRLKVLEEAAKESDEIAALQEQIRRQDAAAATNRSSVESSRAAPININSAKYGRSFQMRMPQ